MIGGICAKNIKLPGIIYQDHSVWRHYSGPFMFLVDANSILLKWSKTNVQGGKTDLYSLFYTSSTSVLITTRASSTAVFTTCTYYIYIHWINWLGLFWQRTFYIFLISHCNGVAHICRFRCAEHRCSVVSDVNTFSEWWSEETAAGDLQSLPAEKKCSR